MQKKTDGQALFDQVIRRLEITQKEYFGLEYEDEHKTPVRDFLMCLDVHVITHA